MHEVALAVELVDPSKYNSYAGKQKNRSKNGLICSLLNLGSFSRLLRIVQNPDRLFKKQAGFFDSHVYTKSRQQLHEELVQLGSGSKVQLCAYYFHSSENCGVFCAADLCVDKDVLETLGYSPQVGDYAMGKDVIQMMKYYTK